jgi:hypothetical protein
MIDLNALVRGLFLFLDIRPYTPPTCGPLSTFLGPFGGAQMAKKLHKKLFSGCLGQILLKEWT